MGIARPAVTVCVLATALGGCRSSITDADREVARAVVDVVERNMTAAEAGDARAYCGTFTEHYLHDRFRGGFTSCVRRFRGPAAATTRSKEIRYLNASPSSDHDALVHFSLGKARKLDYVMKLTAAPAGSRPGTRWLIDGRAPVVQD